MQGPLVHCVVNIVWCLSLLYRKCATHNLSIFDRLWTCFASSSIPYEENSNDIETEEFYILYSESSKMFSRRLNGSILSLPFIFLRKYLSRIALYYRTELLLVRRFVHRNGIYLSLFFLSFSFPCFSSLSCLSIYLPPLFLAASVASGQVLSLLRLARENEIFFNLELVHIRLAKKSISCDLTLWSIHVNEQGRDCCDCFGKIGGIANHELEIITGYFI